MDGDQEIEFVFSKACFDVKPDLVDFRDKIYIPTLIEVPVEVPLEDYQSFHVPIFNQGREGACTGFGLATVANYLLRRRRVKPDDQPVSSRMFYEMAKRYDEWPGEGYQGSSARGAMKGWHKHGVCLDASWPYVLGKEDRILTNERAVDAAERPLGAYFRVNHKDLVAMHVALAEVGVLFATGYVHMGWGQVGSTGLIPFEPDFQRVGGHAFAIVAYDRSGFWIQNSWGTKWGRGGFAKISYDDWLENSVDVWVARLGVPVSLRRRESTAANSSPGAQQSQSYAYSDLRPHVISLSSDGGLKIEGTYGNSEAEVESFFDKDILRITDQWEKKRILIYAHGGLVGESVLLQRVAEYRSALLDYQVYPLALAWHTDFWSTITNIIKDAIDQRRPEEGAIDKSLDFMLDRLDDTLEPLVRSLNGKMLWDELKESAERATQDPNGGARLVLQCLSKLVEKNPEVEIHLAAHSAGSIFLAPFVQFMTTRGKINQGNMAGKTGLGLKVASCSLWAPAITVARFKETYLPAIQSGMIERFSLFTLTDEAERSDHCAGLYKKSLLYLVANALEDQPYDPLFIEKRGHPLVGMEKFIMADPELMEMLKMPSTSWGRAPNNLPAPRASKARGHGDFDDDPSTLMSTLANILPANKRPRGNIFEFGRSTSSLRDRRRQIEKVSR